MGSRRVAADGRQQVGAAQIPPSRDPRSTAQIQYDLVVARPYELTSDDVMFAARGEPKGLAREEFFAKGQPCFRSSTLVKRYGWGVHSDATGRVALVAMESDEYRRLAADPALRHLRGMRSSRRASTSPGE